MSPRLRTRLVQVGSFVLAGLLLYLALRGVDLASVGQALREADYRWLFPLIAVVLVSHLLRAWRWQVLLAALPSISAAPAPRVSLRTAFYSIMIGYMVNYAAPRLGEVVRTGNLATRERLRFSAVLGTVVVERVLDVLVLALALVSVFLLFLDRFAVLDRLFIEPLVTGLGRVPALGLAGLMVALAVLASLAYRQILRRESALQALWVGRIRPIAASFRDGLLTLLRTRRPVALLGSTLAMWFCYLLMAYLPLLILDMPRPYGLSLLDAWAIMTLGSVGVAIPSPGGTGSYHFITIQTLVHLFQVDQAAAASYAVLTHGAQLLLYVLVGTVCLLLQGSSLRSLRAASEEAQEGPAGGNEAGPATSRQTRLHREETPK